MNLQNILNELNSYVDKKTSLACGIRLFANVSYNSVKVINFGYATKRKYTDRKTGKDLRNLVVEIIRVWWNPTTNEFFLSFLDGIKHFAKKKDDIFWYGTYGAKKTTINKERQYLIELSKIKNEPISYKYMLLFDMYFQDIIDQIIKENI